MKHALLATALLLAGVSTADAGSVTATLPVTIQAPLGIAFSPAAPSIACNTPAGAIVAAMSPTGGDGNPATYTASSGDTGDFAVNGSNIVVGPSGIAAAHCGQVNTLGITETQP